MYAFVIDYDFLCTVFTLLGAYYLILHVWFASHWLTTLYLNLSDEIYISRDEMRAAILFN